MNMLDKKLDGTGEPAKGYQGRVLQVQDRDLKPLTRQILETQEKEFREASASGSTHSLRVKAHIGEAKKAVPELADASGRTVTRAIADDFQNLNKVTQAIKEDRYRAYKHEDGSTEQGIVVMKDGAPERDGQWVQTGPKGQIRQIANFKEGVSHGTYRNYRDDGTLAESGYHQDGVRQGTRLTYNEQGKPIREERFENGQQTGAREIDPVKAMEEREAAKALRRISIGRPS